MRDRVRVLVGQEDHPQMAELIESRGAPLEADLDSDESLNTWMMQEVSTGQHISCTAKMSPVSDRIAEVDQFGKVHGADSLRVADASILPDYIHIAIAKSVPSIIAVIAGHSWNYTILNFLKSRALNLNHLAVPHLNRSSRHSL